MKAFKAFWAALGVFCLTVLLCHGLGRAGVGGKPESYALWASEEKSRSLAGLRENLTDQTLPVFGSSEFMHGRGEPFHPSQVFAGSDVTPMLIGAGYYQSLSHAVTLSALQGEMSLRRAVLILSPQWFRKTGVVDQAYTSRFSEPLFDAMLESETISPELKDYFLQRTRTLLAPDPGTLSKVEKDAQYLAGEMASPWERFFEKLWLGFLEEKDRFSIAVREFLPGGSRWRAEGKDLPGERRSLSGEDWEALLQLAAERGEEENQNEFFIGQESYERLLPVLPLKKGMNADADRGYQTGPEFQDLRSFLTAAREAQVEAMVVLVPVNGYYYDYTQFPAPARQAYYEKIRTLVKEEGGVLADFSGEEYTRYFFEDRVHLGKVGWVKVNQAIYDFAREGAAPDGKE